MTDADWREGLSRQQEVLVLDYVRARVDEEVNRELVTWSRLVWRAVSTSLDGIDEAYQEEQEQAVLNAVWEILSDLDTIAAIDECPGCVVIRQWRPTEPTKCPGCGAERRFQGLDSK